MSETDTAPSVASLRAETVSEAAPFQVAAEILRADPRVRAAWGFGSRAHGGAGPKSDVDLAVWLEEPPSLMEKLRLRADLVRGLGRDDVDLVVMDEAPPLLRFEVISAGGRLFARDAENADDFQIRCIREYLDTRHLREVQRRLAREAVRDSRAESIRERLRKLRQTLAQLEPLSQVALHDFVADYRHYWLAERGLQLAAENVFDIGTHILAGRFHVSPGTYEEIPERLAEKGVISGDLRHRLKGLGGFRNILVHDYLDLDRTQLHDFLREDLASLGDYAEEVEHFLIRG